MTLIRLKQIGLFLLAEMFDLELCILFVVKAGYVVFNYFLLHFDDLHVALLFIKGVEWLVLFFDKILLVQVILNV